ncbi:MAG: hypothetical protein B6V02_03365 [Thermoprotei archaeon ex4572_64]|nr:MAG: hypothetical protein B6V02_03365 [Thermoprotei archaeon ex4572_64]
MSEIDVESRAREIVIKLRNFETELLKGSIDVKLVKARLKDIVKEARDYGLDKAYISIIRRIKTLIDRLERRRKG